MHEDAMLEDGLDEDVTGREVPPEMIGRLRPDDRAKAVSWWNGLEDDAKALLGRLFDDDDDAWANVGEEGAFEGVTIELRARFVDPEEASEDAMWTQDLIEYVNARPEMRFHLEERSFHICRAHPAAESVVRTGRIPSAFTCPLGHARCPLSAASALGADRAVVLEARFGARQERGREA